MSRLPATRRNVRNARMIRRAQRGPQPSEIRRWFNQHKRSAENFEIEEGGFGRHHKNLIITAPLATWGLRRSVAQSIRAVGLVGIPRTRRIKIRNALETFLKTDRSKKEATEKYHDLLKATQDEVLANLLVNAAMDFQSQFLFHAFNHMDAEIAKRKNEARP